MSVKDSRRRGYGTPPHKHTRSALLHPRKRHEYVTPRVVLLPIYPHNGGRWADDTLPVSSPTRSKSHSMPCVRGRPDESKGARNILLVPERKSGVLRSSRAGPSSLPLGLASGCLCCVTRPTGFYSSRQGRSLEPHQCMSIPTLAATGIHTNSLPYPRTDS